MNEFNEYEDSYQGKEEDLNIKPSIFTPHVYAIARLEFFRNCIYIYAIGLLVGLILGAILFLCHIDFNTFKSPILLNIILFIGYMYLSIMNGAKRIYDLEWGQTKQAAFWIAFCFNLLNCIPIIGVFVYLIIGLVLLFAPSKKS